MKVQKYTITQIRLVRFGEIPINKLANQKYLKILAEKYGFGKAQIKEDNVGEPVVRFQNGLFPYRDDDYVINKLTIESRKIINAIDGPSEISDQWFQDFRTFLVDMSGDIREKFLEPILVSEESEVVVKLELFFNELFSNPFNEFIKSDVIEKFQSEIADVSISPEGFVFNVDYREKDENLGKSRISLTNKEFIIAPQPGSLLPEKMYYSKAPVGTQDHIELLTIFEQKMVN